MGRLSRKRRHLDSTHPPTPPSSPLQTEVEACIEAIYDCFYRAFDRAPQSDKPKTIWDRESLADKVKELARTVGEENVVIMMQRKTSEFVGKLLTAVREERDMRMSLTLLEDAFDFLEQAVTLIESLLDCPSFLHPSKQEFYTSLLLDPRLKSLLDLSPSRDSTQSMTLDQLLAFIDPSASPLDTEERETAQEIAAFRDALNKPSLCTERIQPKYSQEWLRRLAQRVEEGGI